MPVVPLAPTASSSGGAGLWVRVEWLLLSLCLATMLCQTLPSAFGELQTDFPNYYTAAKVATQGTDAAHLYEWRWLARQKDHFQVDRALIGLVPITPFSTLAIAPLTRLSALQATVGSREWMKS